MYTYKYMYVSHSLITLITSRHGSVWPFIPCSSPCLWGYLHQAVGHLHVTGLSLSDTRGSMYTGIQRGSTSHAMHCVHTSYCCSVGGHECQFQSHLQEYTWLTTIWSTPHVTGQYWMWTQWAAMNAWSNILDILFFYRKFVWWFGWYFPGFTW